MSKVQEFQQRVVAATSALENRKNPDSQVALTEMQETAMRHKLMACGVETFQRDAHFAGPQPGLKWHFTGCGQSSYGSEQAAFRAACEVVGVTPDAALNQPNGSTDPKLAEHVDLEQLARDAHATLTVAQDAWDQTHSEDVGAYNRLNAARDAVDRADRALAQKQGDCKRAEFDETSRSPSASLQARMACR